MKTLTLFRAFERAEKEFSIARDDLFAALMNESKDDYDCLGEQRSKRYRQVEKFRTALTKRLQEQEEELEFYRTVRHVGETYKDAWEQLAKGENK